MQELIAIIAGAMTIIGFLAVFIKIGIDKGDTSRRIETLEDKVDDHIKDYESTSKEFQLLQRDTASFMGRIEANLDFIKQAISELKNKNDKGEK